MYDNYGLGQINGHFFRRSTEPAPYEDKRLTKVRSDYYIVRLTLDQLTDDETLYNHVRWLYGIPNEIGLRIDNDYFSALFAERNPDMTVCKKCLTMSNTRCRWYNDYISAPFAIRLEYDPKDKEPKPIEQWKIAISGHRRLCDRHINEKLKIITSLNPLPNRR